MPAYYNEIDPYAAQWLRNLIAADLIASGEVDERSILDVRADDLKSFTQCHFFAGIGGWSHALRLAGWPDERPVWTGSCPCQPFSVAGKRKGFDDDGHLWPAFRFLISERRPATVFGEQVASATEWLGLVRSDLENLDYAVGAIPIEAASAGADHKRDRFWFVGHDTRVGRGEGRPEHGVRSGRPALAGAGGAIDMADADGARPQGRGLLPERPGERVVGSDGLADAPSERWDGRQNPAGTHGRDGIEANGVADAECQRRHRWEGSAQRNEHDGADAGWQQSDSGVVSGGEAYSWVTGADGKARRVKPGIRLLAHDVPARVAKLRAFGNAIVPQVAAEFIAAYAECEP